MSRADSLSADHIVVIQRETREGRLKFFNVKWETFRGKIAEQSFVQNRQIIKLCRVMLYGTKRPAL